MANKFVQFSDSTAKTIVAVFSCEQDSVQYPNQGTLDETDPRYTAFSAANHAPWPMPKS